MGYRSRGRNVVRKADFLQLLARSKPKRQRALISLAESSEITALAECIYNIAKNNIPISVKKKNKLLKYKKHLRGICSRSTPIKRKKQILLKGGFLPHVIGALLPTALGMVKNLFMPSSN